MPELVAPEFPLHWLLHTVLLYENAIEIPSLFDVIMLSMTSMFDVWSA